MAQCAVMDSALPVLSALLPAIPIVGTLVLLIVLAVTRWNAHPRVSMFAVSGLGLELFLTVVSRTVFTLLPMWMQQNGESMSRYGMISAGLGVVLSLFHAIAMGLIGAAIFAERQR